MSECKFEIGDFVTTSLRELQADRVRRVIDVKKQRSGDQWLLCVEGFEDRYLTQGWFKLHTRNDEGEGES